MRGSANFQVYDRNLRRMFMSSLLDHMESERPGAFRASLVVNSRTGFAIEPRSSFDMPSLKTAPSP